MSEVDRSQFLTVTRASVEAASETAKRYMGGPLRVETGTRKYLRFMPAFKLNASGIPIWFSYGMRHYGIPVIGSTEGKKIRMDCPATIGGRCLPCEHKADYMRLGVWEGFDGCSPRKRVYLNVIDIQNIDAGVQVLEDGPKLWSLLREEFEEENEMLFDPFEGSVLVVMAKDADPWRKIKYPQSHQCSLDEIHPDAMTWALPGNLPDLDAQWNFPTLTEQIEIFGHMFDTSRQLEAAPVQQQIVAPKQEVVEAEVVTESEAPRPESPLRGPAAILAEAGVESVKTPVNVSPPPKGAIAAILVEEGEAPTQPVSQPATSGAGSAALASYKLQMEEDDDDE